MAERRLGSARDARRLRLLLGVVFLGLALPAAFLIRQAVSQLELESFRREQLLAEGFVQRVDATLAAAIAIEDARPFSDYQFAIAALVDGAQVLKTSPLSAFPPVANVPGTLGYFQVDAAGELSTPMLPSDSDGLVDFGIDDAERAARAELEGRLLGILAENSLVLAPAGGVAGRAADIQESARRDTPASPDELVRQERTDAPTELDSAASEGRNAVASTAVFAQGASPDEGARQRALEGTAGPADVRGQAAFDRLTANAPSPRTATPIAAPVRQVSDTAADAEIAAADADARDVASFVEDRANTEREQAAEQAAGAVGDDTGRASGVGSVATEEAEAKAVVAAFQSELEPLRFSRLDTGHLVLFRNAWRDGERFVQGALIDQQAFLQSSMTGVLATAGLAPGTQLSIVTGSAELAKVAVVDAGVSELAGGPAGGQPVFSARLSPPLADIALFLSADRLPRGPTYDLIIWTAVVLFAVLVGGLVATYRFGIKQIDLARQQRNFVSAVSHELKTPLTSIRMYGEMLKSGWASEDKKKDYYDFIFSEGERLTRLIDNVLALARLDGGSAVTLGPVTVDEIVDMIRSKVSTQIEHAKLELEIDVDPAVGAEELLVDADAVAQVFINLVDNAIKFGGDAARGSILLRAWAADQHGVVLSIRDFGPGIAEDGMRRLFELFYRPDNELTRATAGTGIGLALVRQLVTAMGGRVDVRNCDPGAEFRVTLKTAAAAGD